jgi:predicted nucleotidyltransferase
VVYTYIRNWGRSSFRLLCVERASEHDGGVSRSRIEVVGGRVLYDGQTLSDWAPVVADRIYRRCNAEQVVLFGSVARGEEGADSDIDLLVVLPVVHRRHDAAVAVLRELRDLSVPIDVMVVDPPALERERRVPGVVRVALSEGRPLAASAACRGRRSRRSWSHRMSTLRSSTTSTASCSGFRRSFTLGSSPSICLTSHDGPSTVGIRGTSTKPHRLMRSERSRWRRTCSP